MPDQLSTLICSPVSNLIQYCDSTSFQHRGLPTMCYRTLFANRFSASAIVSWSLTELWTGTTLPQQGGIWWSSRGLTPQRDSIAPLSWPSTKKIPPKSWIYWRKYSREPVGGASGWGQQLIEHFPPQYSATKCSLAHSQLCQNVPNFAGLKRNTSLMNFCLFIKQSEYIPNQLI